MNLAILYNLDLFIERTLRAIIQRHNRWQSLTMTSGSLDQIFELKEGTPQLLFLPGRIVNDQLVERFYNLHQLSPQLGIWIYFDFPQKIDDTLLGGKPYLHSLSLPVSVRTIDRVIDQAPSSTEEDSAMMLLTTVLVKKNYQVIYQRLPELSRLLYEKRTDVEVDQTAQTFLTVERLTDMHDQKQVEQLHQLVNERWSAPVESQEEFTLWLFEFLDAFFQLRVTHKTPRLAPAFQFINGHLNQQITAKEIADCCNFSLNYTNKLANESLGIGFHQYVQIRQIQLAKERFFFADGNVSEVAISLGFNDQGYFSKVFKRISGQSPSAYMRTLKRREG